MERCTTCQFFDRHDARGAEGKAAQWGQCRRSAPRLNPINAKPHMIEGVWPHVRGDDWCGEYKGLAKRLDEELTQLLGESLLPERPTDPAKPRFTPIALVHDADFGSKGA